MGGGWDPQTTGTGGILLEDVHQYDAGTNKWTQLSCKLPDGPTSRHVAVTIHSKNPEKCRIVLHTHRCTDHALVFDGASFRKQPVSGDIPSSRSR